MQCLRHVLIVVMINYLSVILRMLALCMLEGDPISYIFVLLPSILFTPLQNRISPRETDSTDTKYCIQSV